MGEHELAAGAFLQSHGLLGLRIDQLDQGGSLAAEVEPITHLALAREGSPDVGEPVRVADGRAPEVFQTTARGGDLPAGLAGDDELREAELPRVDVPLEGHLRQMERVGDRREERGRAQLAPELEHARALAQTDRHHRGPRDLERQVVGEPPV